MGGDVSDHLFINALFEFVDFTVFGLDQVRERVVALQQSPDTLAEAAFRQAAHHEQFLADIVQVLFPVDAHGLEKSAK